MRHTAFDGCLLFFHRRQKKLFHGTFFVPAAILNHRFLFAKHFHVGQDVDVSKETLFAMRGVCSRRITDPRTKSTRRLCSHFRSKPPPRGL
jgi:hypothetical protein